MNAFNPKPGHRSLRKGRVSLPNQAYLVTTTTLNRQAFFVDFAVACAAARCFEKPEILGDAHMLAWVLMPDHVHWLIQLGQRDALNLVVNRLKSFSARMVNQVLRREGALWAVGYHDHALRADEDLRVAARYIVANPLRARLVQRVADYPSCNAVWL